MTITIMVPETDKFNDSVYNRISSIVNRAFDAIGKTTPEGCEAVLEIRSGDKLEQ
jgi:hypothetical protein